jgi:hypothetical protein
VGHTDGPLSNLRLALHLLLGNQIVQVGLVLVVVGLVYLPSLDAYFHGDDFVSMVDVAGRPVIPHLVDVFTFQDHDYYWRPLGVVYYRAVYEMAGLDPFWFRVANLGVFFVTLVLLHRLAIRLGVSPVGALAAVLLVGLFANHVVSVAWITNGSRLLAALFVIAALLLLHEGLRRRSLVLEVGAWLGFVAACLSDEVTIALLPLPVLFAAFLFWQQETKNRLVARGFAYGIVLAALLPLQFLFTPDDEWRLSRYHFSPDVAEQAWALAAQLVLPLTNADPMDVWFKNMPTEQWVAGALALVIAMPVAILGSNLMRFLLLWIGAALAPFTLWDFDVVSPRYTYLAAFPFAVLAVLLCARLLESIRIPQLRAAMLLPMTGVLSAALIYGASATIERNEDFEAAAEQYERAAARLQATVPDIAPGTRVVLYYGPWRNQDFWLQAMLRTIYEEPSIVAVNVPPESVPAVAPPAGPQDLILYYSPDQISRQRPLASR